MNSILMRNIGVKKYTKIYGCWLIGICRLQTGLWMCMESENMTRCMTLCKFIKHLHYTKLPTASRMLSVNHVICNCTNLRITGKQGDEQYKDV